ncbi:hypothetical protein [Kitasatospora cineracea]|uniref:Uncharacterized protein n=1 Tax=Kitasatospora cineracea TaxID=88074 RepID=A0A3N4RXI7_9ACTN|nr:hypothetical protein [Kitasatospora cineracea]ROR37775.1 hypothetical protein EDD39_5930 [Kitasatospora cineracea]RPE28804.1 hypothetical protein EDD38_5948 [Kitasatospora cineracea]
MMKLRTLVCGAALAAANLLLPVPQAQAAPPAPHPVMLCGFAPRPAAPAAPVLLATPLHPC